jgi:serine/threonine-protein kinase
VKLLDFGIARSMHAPRLTSIGEIFGTPQYMAPERISSIDAGPSADLYSLGVICFEMLAGCLPYEADDPATYFARHMTAPVPSLASIGVRVPSLLDALVKSLMAKKPVERPVDAHRVLADLTRAASEAGVAIPSDPVEAPPSSWQAPKTLPPVGIEQWVRRTVVFEQMLQRAYRSKPPAEASSRLARIRESVGEIASLRSRGVEAQNELEALEAQEREGRQRLGFAVDALGVDLSRAREEARAARALADASAARIKAHTARMRELQREIGFWEGRSAFVEPYRELAAAYRAAADEVEAWMVHRDEDVQERAVAEQADLVVADLEYQIHELRAGLVRLEQTMARQREQIEARLADLGRRADEMEGELLRLATELCEPIRKNPAVASLFRELEESR